MPITLQPDLEQFVQREIATGQYPDASATSPKHCVCSSKSAVMTSCAMKFGWASNRRGAANSPRWTWTGFARKFVGQLKSAARVSDGNH